MSQYCQPSDLAIYGAPQVALNSISVPMQTAQCIAASGVADAYMRSRYPLPLLTWGTEITMYVAYIAVYFLFAARGYAHEAGADQEIQRRYYEAVGYPDQPGSGFFPGVERQRIHPAVTFNAPAPGTYTFPAISTKATRGWGGGGSSQSGGISGL